MTWTDFESRAANGRRSRKRSPRSASASWTAAADRPDPVALLEEQAETRVPELVPVRYGRMLASPFAFFRGAALIMAADLAGTSNSGLSVQLCGDAHLSNFGVFASPERALVFDINDFDETLPGPWEWDVMRLAASFEVAGRGRGFSDTDRRASALAVGRGYRTQMRKSARSPVLSAWYERLDADGIQALVQAERDAGRAEKARVARTSRTLAKARSRDSLRAASKIVRVVDGQLRIAADPPLLVPLEDLTPPGRDREHNEAEMRELLLGYQSTLGSTSHPMREFTYVDMARKVVGVGSVGTRAWVVLLSGRDQHDTLLLQAKEAQPSVLTRFLHASEYENQGERVVRGQRLLQASTDIFLGWKRVTDFDGEQRDFYIRQLHDGKGSIDVDVMAAEGALLYARVCGETLARAHARAGDGVAISAYLGKSDRFEQALAEFAAAYADQNELDYRAFAAAVESGRIVTG